MPEFLEVLFGDSIQVKVIYYGTLIGIAFLIGWLLYNRFAPGPRRRRALKQVKQTLASGDWAAALKGVAAARVIGGQPPRRWQRRFDAAEAQCIDQALAGALAVKNFDQALQFAGRIAELRDQSPLPLRAMIQQTMLEEQRRLFSIPGETRGVHDLAERILRVHSPCREATFWKAMAYLRGGEKERATEAFLSARGDDPRSLVDDSPLAPTSGPRPPAIPFIDPSLYLGAMLLRQGRAKDSLVYLTEANRMDQNCPVVTVLLGSAIVEAGGDTKFAVKALQRALGPKGLQMWAGNPAKAWVEAFPEGRSYVRKLATSYPFQCPLFGADLKFLQLQGMLSLAQGLYKLADYQEAANIFSTLIQEGAPSPPVVRGVGLSLARIGKYDEAFRHLRAAHEMENPPERTTAGFLALCGAKGTPKSEEDKRRNLAWAIQTVTPFTAPGDEEWTALINAIFAEARAAHLPVSLDDQLYLCEHLCAIHAIDPVAAHAYEHLLATHPSAVRPEYAWLYCRSAQQHRLNDEHTLDLFALAFADRRGLEAFYGQRGWSAIDVELAYLEKAAQRMPGQFPAALGADYPPRGEELLKQRSLELEKGLDLEGSLAVADILGRLAPGSATAQDRVAGLFYRRGQLEEALQALERWQASHPHDPLPLARRALVLHHEGQTQAGIDLLRAARNLATGKQRGNLAYLAAELTLRQPDAAGQVDSARQHLEAAIADDPAHRRALWLLAALRWQQGDRQGVAALAPALDQPNVVEAPSLYAAALARFAAGDHGRAAELCARLRRDFPVIPRPPAPSESIPGERNGSPPDTPPNLDWAIEAAYLQGLAELERGHFDHARDALTIVARTSDSPSSADAQALLGDVAFHLGHYEEASRWWQGLEQRRRADWKIGEALGGTVFLTALQAMHEGRFEEAAEKLRAAGKLGCRDRRLGQLLILTLFRAGQKAVYGG